MVPATIAPAAKFDRIMRDSDARTFILGLPFGAMLPAENANNLSCGQILTYEPKLELLTPDIQKRLRLRGEVSSVQKSPCGYGQGFKHTKESLRPQGEVFKRTNKSQKSACGHEWKFYANKKSANKAPAATRF